MRLTRFSDYSLRALMFVGLRGEAYSGIAEIAAAYAISPDHLTKVVHRLAQLGLIQTQRGRGGGLRLARPAAEIVVGEVVRRTEEDLSLVDCMGGGACILTGTCTLQHALTAALAAFLDVLDGYTLADLLRPQGGMVAARLGLGV
jgi:Rrf2 family nitric oxide-sensitive transcriptional repressor